MNENGVPTSTPTRSCRDWEVAMACSFGNQDRQIILRSRLPAEPRSLAIGTIPVDPSDDAGDGGGNSQGVSPVSQTTDPNSHTPVGVRLTGYHRPRYPPKFDGRPKAAIELFGLPVTSRFLSCASQRPAQRVIRLPLLLSPLYRT